jgi:hypothetical protein
LVHEACSCIDRKTGADDVDNAAGTIDQERFEQYVECDLVPCLGRFDLGEPRSIVVMDNASTHNSDRIRQLIEGAGAKLVFLPPISPDLNPIEDCFHVYKANLKRSIRDPNITNVDMTHLSALQAVTPKIARAEYRHLRGAIRNVPDEETEEDEEVEVAVAVAVVAVLQDFFL